MGETFTRSVSKILSANDVGHTGSHQAGIAVPRQPCMLDFFPTLKIETFNPRCTILFRELEDNDEWPLNFIYYNGKLHGRSTRNEYRLTGLTPYFRKHEASSGDILQLNRSSTGRFSISLLGSGQAKVEVSPLGQLPPLGTAPEVYETIKLSGAWSALSRRRTSVR
ncbi:EcoRII N-terminal effector-binding domain-containing protein [Paenarthrobacter sp. TA1.8]|uniref:EcoRII N-terminal effector-binding domain-containing protein n=1 Tax=Paenarthrobacter sp. TA1.8 TaxID=3400219 RepID=UPI003B42DFB5